VLLLPTLSAAAHKRLHYDIHRVTDVDDDGFDTETDHSACAHFTGCNECVAGWVEEPLPVLQEHKEETPTQKCQWCFVDALAKGVCGVRGAQCPLRWRLAHAQERSSGKTRVAVEPSQCVNISQELHNEDSNVFDQYGRREAAKLHASSTVVESSPVADDEPAAEGPKRSLLQTTSYETVSGTCTGFLMFRRSFNVDTCQVQCTGQARRGCTGVRTDGLRCWLYRSCPGTAATCTSTVCAYSSTTEGPSTGR